MNTDIDLIFEAYCNRILNEADMGAEYGSFLGAAQSIAQRIGDKYIIDDLVKKTGESIEKCIESIVKPIYDSLFVDGVFKAVGSEKEQLNKLQNAIHNKLVELGYPKARAGYTARIIKNSITPAIQFLNNQAAEGEDVDMADVEDAVADSITDTNTEIGDELEATPETAPSTVPTEGSDKETNALMQYAVDQASDGIKEDELIEILKQHVVQKDPEVSDARAKGRVRGIISKLINAKVLSKRGNTIEPGDNADEYAASGDLSSVTLDPKEYAAREFGVGARPTTGRQVFGGEGGRHGVDFG